MSDDKPKNTLLSAFSRDNAKVVARGYSDLTFIKKPKNILGLFFIAISILSILLVSLAGSGEEIAGMQLTMADMFVGIGIYLFLTIFIFMNHRWAMVMACVIYLLDKALFILSGGFAISQIIFGFLCLSLTWHAVLVASEIRKFPTDDISTFD